MAHVMGNLKTGLDPLMAEWFQHINSGSLHTVALGSGAVVGTFDTGGGWLKGILMTTFNTPAFSIRDNAATMFSFASGAVGDQLFQPVWGQYKNTLSLAKASGTAETWYLLVATSAKDIAK